LTSQFTAPAPAGGVIPILYGVLGKGSNVLVDPFFCTDDSYSAGAPVLGWRTRLLAFLGQCVTTAGEIPHLSSGCPGLSHVSPQGDDGMVPCVLANVFVRSGHGL